VTPIASRGFGSRECLGNPTRVTFAALHPKSDLPVLMMLMLFELGGKLKRGPGIVDRHAL
jgi:hypothetical protein